MEPEPTLEEIHQKGLLAFRDALGRDGLIRFLQYFSNGSGDYAKNATPGLTILRWRKSSRKPVSAKRRKNAHK